MRTTTTSSTTSARYAHDPLLLPFAPPFLSSLASFLSLTAAPKSRTFRVARSRPLFISFLPFDRETTPMGEREIEEGKNKEKGKRNKERREECQKNGDECDAVARARAR